MRTAEKFWAYVEKTNNCWLWRGSLNNQGYGNVRWFNKTLKAHRVAYELTYSSIPEGLDLDHLCRTRNCVNPEHLEPVTRQENILRGEGVAAEYLKRTHCKKGHEYAVTGFWVWKNSRARICKICSREKGIQDTLKYGEKRRSYGRSYYRANREKILAQQKQRKIECRK